MSTNSWIYAIQQWVAQRNASDAVQQINNAANTAASNAAIRSLSNSNSSLFQNVQDLSDRCSDLSAQADFWNRVYHEDTRALAKAFDEMRGRMAQELTQLVDEVNAWEALARSPKDEVASDVEELFRSKMEEQRSDAEWVKKRDAWVAGQLGPGVTLPKRWSP